MTTNPKILLVGSQGALSKSFVTRCIRNKIKIKLISQSKHLTLNTHVFKFGKNKLDLKVFKDVEILIFMAGFSDNDDKCKLKSLNVDYPLYLLKASLSVLKNVNFVYLSSSKVNKSITEINPIEENYIYSKIEAEKKLFEFQKNYINRLNLLVLRPSPIYGVNIENNIMSFVKFSQGCFASFFPLVNNKRGILNINNLFQVIEKFISHPQNYKKPITVSDQKIYSMNEMIDLTRSVLGKPKIFFRFPLQLYKILAYLGDNFFVFRFLFNSNKYKKFFNNEYFKDDCPTSLKISEKFYFEDYLREIKMNIKKDN